MQHDAPHELVLSFIYHLFEQADFCRNESFFVRSKIFVQMSRFLVRSKIFVAADYCGLNVGQDRIACGIRFLT